MMSNREGDSGELRGTRGNCGNSEELSSLCHLPLCHSAPCPIFSGWPGSWLRGGKLEVVEPDGGFALGSGGDEETDITGV